MSQSKMLTLQNIIGSSRSICISCENTVWMLSAEVILKNLLNVLENTEMHKSMIMNDSRFCNFLKADFFKSWTVSLVEDKAEYLKKLKRQKAYYLEKYKAERSQKVNILIA